MARKKRALPKSATAVKVTPPTTTTARAQAELARAMREDAQRLANSLTDLPTNPPLDADTELSDDEFFAKVMDACHATWSRADAKSTVFDVVDELAGVNPAATTQRRWMLWGFLHTFVLLDTFGPRVWRLDPGFDPVLQVMVAVFAPIVCLQVLLVRLVVYGLQRMIELTAAGNKRVSAYVMADLGPASTKSLQPLLHGMPLPVQLLSLVSIYAAARLMVLVWKLLLVTKTSSRAAMETYEEFATTVKEKIQRAILLGEDGDKNRNAMTISSIRQCGVAHWIMHRLSAHAKEASGERPQQQPQPAVLDTVIVKQEVAPVYPVVHLATPQRSIEAL